MYKYIYIYKYKYIPPSRRRRPLSVRPSRRPSRRLVQRRRRGAEKANFRIMIKAFGLILGAGLVVLAYTLAPSQHLASASCSPSS